MKYLRFISPISLLIYSVSLLLPYCEFVYISGPSTGLKIVQSGSHFSFVVMPMTIMLSILLIANIKRTRFSAIIAFVICFGLIFSLFLLKLFMDPFSSYDIVYSIRYGYFVALFSAVLLMVILLINLVLFFKKNIQRKSDPT